MKESLRTFAQKKLSELGQFFRVPANEELVANFPHDKQCSKSGKLNLTKKLVHIPGSGGFDPGISGGVRTLKCDECEVSQEY